MTKGNGVTISIGELGDVGIALLAQIDVKGLIRRGETGVFAIGGQQLFDTCTLEYIGERTERLGTVVEVVGNHFPRKRIEILFLYLLHTR